MARFYDDWSHGATSPRTQCWLLLLWFGSLLGPAALWGQAETFRERLHDLSKQGADAQVQIDALNEFLGSADERIANLDTAITQLQSMDSTLADINKKNLIKVIFQLAFETYSTIDKTTGLAKTGVESVANYGVRYAAGRIAFEETSEAARKAMGLDENSYYSSRCVSIQRLTEESFRQSSEVAKVYWALDKDLAYYRSLKKQETGEDPGQRGAIFFKNIVVREAITGAIAALQSLSATIRNQQTQAEKDLAWLEGEAASISSLIEGVELQLENALQDEQEAAIEAGQAEIESATVDPGEPPLFQFRGMAEDEDPYSYFNERYAAGKALIQSILDPLIPEINQHWENWDTAKTEAATDYAAWAEKYNATFLYWRDRSFRTQDDFGSLIDTLFWLRDTQTDLKILQDAERDLSAILSAYEPIESEFGPMNSLIAQTGGCNAIANASWSDTVTEGGNTYHLSNLPPTYSLHQYSQDTENTPDWGPASFSALPSPVYFDVYYENIHQWEMTLDDLVVAQENIQAAHSDFQAYWSGLQSAINGVTQTENAAVGAMESAVGGIESTLSAAEALSADKVYCPLQEAEIYYLGLHPHSFSVYALNSAIGEALVTNPDATTARALWNDYVAFVPTYEEQARAYGLAAAYGRSTAARLAGEPPSFLAEVRDAHAVAIELGQPEPSIPVAGLETIRSNYYSAKTSLTPVLSWADARSLPDVRILEDLNDAIPPEMEAPYVKHPLAQALPAFGLLLIKEAMDTRFAQLLAMNERDRDAMQSAIYELSRMIDEWKAATESGLLRMNLWSAATNLQNDQLYAFRIQWEETFGPPYITGHSGPQAVTPGSSTTLWVNVTSKESVSYQWYRDEWFGDDEPIGTGRTLTVGAPDGLEFYYCKASSVYGDAYTGRIEVYPAIAPQIAFQPQPVNTLTGQPAQLQADFYLTSGAAVETTASWFVSEGSDPGGKFLRVPDSASNVLNLRCVTATRYYYHEVSNPWGTTRTDTVGVFLTDGVDAPAVIPPPEILRGYSNKPFSFPFSGANLTRYEWQAPDPNPGLTFDGDRGVVSGTLATAPGTTVAFSVRAVRDGTGGTARSSWVPVSITVYPQNEYPGTSREQWFYGDQFSDESISGPFADPDGDGIVNLVEYALGTSPTSDDSDGTGMPTFDVGTNRGRLSFTKPIAPSGFYYVVEYSSDLENWFPIKSITGNIVKDSYDTETVTYETPATDLDGNPIVMRVRVVEL